MYIRTYPKKKGRKFDVGGYFDSKQTTQSQQQLQQQPVKQQNTIQRPELSGLNSTANANDYLSAVPVVGQISGAVGSIVDPIEQDMKEVDPLTGKYKDSHDAYVADVNRSFFDPLTTGSRALQDDGASTGEKIGSFLGFGAAWSKDRTARQEKANIEKVNEYNTNMLRQNRLANLDQSNQKNYSASFANGGMIKTYANVGLDRSYPSDLAALQAARDLGVTDPLLTDLTTYETKRLNKSGDDTAPVNGVDKESFEIYNAEYRPRTTAMKYYSNELARAMGTNKEAEARAKYNAALTESQKANGGQLEGTKGHDNITYFGNGGTHESNKLGGIPLGSTGNSVEQGEVRFNNYIFSNRF